MPIRFAWLLLTITVLTSAAVAQLSVPPELKPMSFPPSRDIDFHRYARSLFPADADPNDTASVHAMSDEDKAFAARLLAQKAEWLRDTLSVSEPSIRLALSKMGVAMPASIRLPAKVPLEVMDGPQAVASASADGRVVISGATLRGFLIGSLTEAIRGSSSEGMMLRTTTGWSAKAADATTARWTTRFVQMLALLDSVGAITVSPTEQMAAGQSMFAPEDDEAYDPARFDKLAARVLDDGGEIKPGEYYALWMGLMYLSQTIEAAETFLLAHELGHVALQHKQLTDCGAAARQERDADAFAIAVLTYNQFAGGIDAMMFQAAAVSQKTSPFEFVGSQGEDVDFRRAKYGFIQAFDYGMAQAGMGRAKGRCPFVSAAERRETTDAMWAATLSGRLAAMDSLVRVLRERPSTVGMKQTDVLLDLHERRELLKQAAPQCGSAAARVIRVAGTPGLHLVKYLYFVKCGWPAPKFEDFGEDVRLLVGPEYLQVALATYADPHGSVLEP